MNNKTTYTITIDKPILNDMRLDDLNISGTVNQLLVDRKRQLKNLKFLLQKIEKIELNINNKTSARAEDLVTEIKETKPLITDFIVYLKCAKGRKTTRTLKQLAKIKVMLDDEETFTQTEKKVYNFM